MIKRAHISLYIGVALFFGCDKGPSSATTQTSQSPATPASPAPNVFDPVKADAEVKALARKLLPLIKVKLEQVVKSAGAPSSDTTYTLVGTDIKRSDSLVHPYIAEMVWDERIAPPPGSPSETVLRFRHTLTLSPENGFWTPTKAVRSLEDEIPDRGSPKGVQQSSFADFYADIAVKAQR